jgi:HEAT repeat protein
VTASTGGALLERVRNQDWSVLDESADQQADSVAAVAELSRDGDAGVRDLAVAVLDRLGGPVAQSALLERLRDQDELVRARASRGIRAPADVRALCAELRENLDEVVRAAVALALGRSADPTAAGALAEARRTEADPDVQRALGLALARLGQAEAQTELASRLNASDPRERANALRDLPYVRVPALARRAIELLYDYADAENVGLSHAPQFIRVCDVAIEVLAAILDNPFPFRVARPFRYDASELDAARTIAAERLKARA